MEPLKRIGILGGMGPEATILLQQKLLAAVQTSTDDGHIPLIVDMNPQVPSRIDYLIYGRGPDPAPDLVAMAKRLQMAGAKALAIPCNTAHHFASDITDAVDIPLLNMVEISVEKMAQIAPSGATIGLLASPAVQKTGLFDRALAQKGLRALWPKNDQAMLGAIQMIKKQGACAPASETLLAASEELVRAGARFQFIACSEFSLIAKSISSRARVLDTIDILVGAIKAFSFGTNPLVEQT